MTCQWLRLWHDMPTDPKWRTISRASGQPISLVQSVYIHLLVDASRNVPRLAPMSEKHWKAARIKRVRAEFSDSGYGEDTVKRVVRAMFRSRNDGGAMSIVIEGKTVYQRREAKEKEVSHG